MALDEIINSLKVLVPIAKAVPVLGARYEGSLEALITILELAKVRHSPADLESPSSINIGDRESPLRGKKRRRLPFKPLAG
jgi:hypothetical protein